MFTVLLKDSHRILAFLFQGGNGRHEQVTFLTNEQKMAPARRASIAVGVFIALMVVAAVVGFLVWLFVGTKIHQSYLTCS